MLDFLFVGWAVRQERGFRGEEATETGSPSVLEDGFPWWLYCPDSEILAK
jgi:hypothetical protein